MWWEISPSTLTADSKYMDPTYPLVPIANILSFFLILLALLTIGRPWNIGVCMFAIWAGLFCLITAINTIIWKNGADNIAPVWCDITSHFFVGFNIGIPACSFVITRRIAQIMRLREIVDKRQRMRQNVIDIVICLGIPIISMITYYVVQNHRFLILEEFGCASSPLGSGVQILLLESWCVVLPFLSVLLYLPKIVWHFYHQQKELNELIWRGGFMSRSTYLRILALGCLDILVTLPLGISGLVIDIKENRIVFYQGWTAVHSHWDPVRIPKTLWETIPYTAFNIRWNEWIGVLFAVIFFILFGLTAEARAKHRQFLHSVLLFSPSRQARTNSELSAMDFGVNSKQKRVAPPAVLVGLFTSSSDASLSADSGHGFVS